MAARFIDGVVQMPHDMEAVEQQPGQRFGAAILSYPYQPPALQIVDHSEITMAFAAADLVDACPVQRLMPPLGIPAIGKDVEEIRVTDDAGVDRVIYFARRMDALYVLHAFAKKTRATSKRDIETARKRLAQRLEGVRWGNPKAMPAFGTRSQTHQDRQPIFGLDPN